MGGRQKGDLPCDPSPRAWARALDFPVSGKGPSTGTGVSFLPQMELRRA